MQPPQTITTLCCYHHEQLIDPQTTVSEPFAGIIPTVELFVSSIGSPVVLGSTRPLLLRLPFDFKPFPLAASSAGKFVCLRTFAHELATIKIAIMPQTKTFVSVLNSEPAWLLKLNESQVESNARKRLCSSKSVAKYTTADRARTVKLVANGVAIRASVLASSSPP